jgi:UDP-galactopyranose mutase
MLFSLQTQNHIYLVEHPILTNDASEKLQVMTDGAMSILRPHLPKESSVFDRKARLLRLVREFIREENITSYRFITGTCRSIPYLRHLQPELVIFDQNDEEARIYPELFVEMSQYAD